MRGISLNTDQNASQDLSLGALSYTATYGKPFRLDQILINFSQPVTETVTITCLSAKGTNYNAVIDLVPLDAQPCLVWRPQGEANFKASDRILIQCTNANLIGSCFATIKTSQLGGG